MKTTIAHGELGDESEGAGHGSTFLAISGSRRRLFLRSAQHLGSRVAHRSTHLFGEHGELPEVLAYLPPIRPQLRGELLGLVHDAGRNVDCSLSGFLDVLGGCLTRFDDGQRL